ncbi:MAG: adenosylmethionine--8-amino-7-oxononanoate transaminase [Fibrobacterota bacterium]|nr:adenosylmethionine--8-amino-7-oxononanoate transaminase [Fibrobacterota bacterium]QQS06718.1 MAG: adenosylmethionine--8-amino-7-oxononanoate transaminase [Fibrobacterota bacterium]
MSDHPLLQAPFPKSVFVTGTGTDVGKTLCSAILCALWEADYWKPVQTGQVIDSLEILRLSVCTPIHLSTIHLQEPASPHWAAQLEDFRIDLALLLEEHPQGYSLVIEGAGGALVPLNESEDMIDLAKGLGVPMLVVASTELGTLHHTLATVQCIRSRGVEVAGVLLNGLAHGENARQIRDRGQVKILGRVPPLYPVDAQSIQELCRHWLLDPWVDPCTEETPRSHPSNPDRTLQQRDAQCIWHPYTQHQSALPPLEIQFAHGATLHTTDGEEIVDAVSSWWVCNHGHTHPAIAKAIATQARALEQVIFAGCTHEPGVQLAERLLPLLPGQMSRLFYSDNGSTAIEVAIKACVQMARRRGVQRPRVAALEGAYHGDTFGAMAAGSRSVFSEPFEPYLFEVDRLPTPAGCWDPGSVQAQDATQVALKSLGEWMNLHSGEIACLLVEPLIQGSAGMKMYPRAYLEGLDQLCKAHGIPWIADEVFTGFGRTGGDFACRRQSGHPALSPAAVCLSKGLTGGFLPLGATAFREEIFQDFLSEDRKEAFFHGHSFTGNPLGCAAALAALDLLQDPALASQWRQLEVWQRESLATLAQEHPISGMRVLGTIAAFELPDSPGGYLASRGQTVARLCREAGVLVRPLGDTLYVVPPYSIRESQLARVFEALESALRGI